MHEYVPLLETVVLQYEWYRVKRHAQRSAPKAGAKSQVAHMIFEQ